MKENKKKFCIFAKKAFFIFFIGFAFFLIFPQKLGALSFGGVGIRPSTVNGNRDWFIYKLGPGESAEDYVDIFNNTPEEQRILLNVVDSEPSNIGAFALTGPNMEQKGIGKWVVLDEKEVVLKPEESRSVRFTITLPLDADVGEHSGAITASPTRLLKLEGLTGATIGTRVGARVYNTVPGEIVRKIRILDFSMNENVEKREYEFILKVKNEGNVSVSPQARLHIEGWGLLNRTEFFQNQVIDREWQLLRNAEVTTNWQVPIPYFGSYKFYVTLHYEEKENEPRVLKTEVLARTIIPWRDAAILGAILLALVLLIVGLILYRKRKYSGKGWSEYVVGEKDNVMALAQKCHIPWKMLVKVNKIKKPYFLSPGATILLPVDAALKSSHSKKPKKEEEKKKKGKKRDFMKAVILVGIIVLTTVVLILGVLIFVRSIKSSKDAENLNEPKIIDSLPAPVSDTATSTPEQNSQNTATTTEGVSMIILPTSTATTTQNENAQATPSDKSFVKIRILNGSGTKGLATKYADILREDGFSSLETANAPNFSYTETIISYRENFKEAAEAVSKLLEKSYKNFVLQKSDALKSDIEVILGAQ